MVQTYSLPTDGSLRLIIDVQLTNNNASSSEVYYARVVDPDNCRTRVTVVCDGDGVADTIAEYRTTNTITGQRRDGNARTTVTATQTDGSLIALTTRDAESVAFAGAYDACPFPWNLAPAYAQPRTATAASPWVDDDNCDWINKVGEGKHWDDNIVMVIHRTIAPGATANFSLEYVLSSLDAATPVGVTVTASSPDSIPAGSAVPAIGFTNDADLVAGDWTTQPSCAVYTSADTTFTTPLSGVQTAGTYVTHCTGGTPVDSEYAIVNRVDGTLVVTSASLPATGINVLWSVAIALTLVSLGTAATMARRRRTA